MKKWPARAADACDQIYSGLVPGEGEAVVASTRWRLRADPGSTSGWAWDVVNVKMFDGDDARLTPAEYIGSGDAGSGWAAANVGQPSGAWGGRKDAEGSLWIGMRFASAVSVSRAYLREMNGENGHRALGLSLEYEDGAGEWKPVCTSDVNDVDEWTVTLCGGDGGLLPSPSPTPEWCACGWWCSPQPECNGEQCNGTGKCGVGEPHPHSEGPQCACGREAASARRRPCRRLPAKRSWRRRASRARPARPPSATTTATARAGGAPAAIGAARTTSATASNAMARTMGTTSCAAAWGHRTPTLKGPSARAVREAASARQASPS